MHEELICKLACKAILCAFCANDSGAVMAFDLLCILCGLLTLSIIFETLYTLDRFFTNPFFCIKCDFRK